MDNSSDILDNESVFFFKKLMLCYYLIIIMYKRCNEELCTRFFSRNFFFGNITITLCSPGTAQINELINSMIE